jgi:hypothetical protein
VEELVGAVLGLEFGLGGALQEPGEPSVLVGRNSLHLRPQSAVQSLVTAVVGPALPAIGASTGVSGVSRALVVVVVLGAIALVAVALRQWRGAPDPGGRPSIWQQVSERVPRLRRSGT